MHPLKLLPPRFENQTFWLLGKLRESALFEIKDKSIRVKLVIVSLLEHNLNKQISHFRSFNSIRKVNIGESFGSSTFNFDTALGFLSYYNFAEILFATLCLVKIT